MPSKMARAIKKMGDKKVTDDDVSGDVLKLLEEDALKVMIQLIKDIHETGEWPKNFIEVTMTALKKKPKATKCSNHCTVSIIVHTAKIVVRILRRRMKRKIGDVLREDQFGFRRGKGTREATVMLRIISEQILDEKEELCACFIDGRRHLTVSPGPN
jgi:hypothetical protein